MVTSVSEAPTFTDKSVSVGACYYTSIAIHLQLEVL